MHQKLLKELVSRKCEFKIHDVVLLLCIYGSEPFEPLLTLQQAADVMTAVRHVAPPFQDKVCWNDLATAAVACQYVKWIEDQLQCQDCNIGSCYQELAAENGDCDFAALWVTLLQPGKGSPELALAEQGHFGPLHAARQAWAALEKRVPEVRRWQHEDEFEWDGESRV